MNCIGLTSGDEDIHDVSPSRRGRIRVEGCVGRIRCGGHHRWPRGEGFRGSAHARRRDRHHTGIHRLRRLRAIYIHKRDCISGHPPSPCVHQSRHLIRESDADVPHVVDSITRSIQGLPIFPATDMSVGESPNLTIGHRVNKPDILIGVGHPRLQAGPPEVVAGDHDGKTRRIRNSIGAAQVIANRCQKGVQGRNGSATLPLPPDHAFEIGGVTVVLQRSHGIG